MENCKYCNKEFEPKLTKLFCSRNCKYNFRYKNDLTFREGKISKSKDRVLNERFKSKMELNEELIKKAGELQISSDALQLYNLIFRK